jgi:ABC-type lipoprotein export system ATPase subunit
MTEKYTRARFWKCALQVNPANYIAYRGEDHGMTEDQYNQELLRICKEEDIAVIGFANHGSVNGLEAIRKIMNQNGIIVFPGFEISSSEKAHFVCLFPETTTLEELNRYLGSLGLTNSEKDAWPSNLGGNDLLKKVDELGGFAYAAHCTEGSGVLCRRLHHVWQNPLLRAAQIKGALDDLNGNGEQGYHQILLNKIPEYQRDISIALINAKDVAKPDDLYNSETCCLIKMTKPCFSSFKQAFLDPESRVRLLSEVPEQYYSCIESIKFTGGYLDGLELEFSEHLNAVIGGRGTGKSTLLECIRYVLDLQPVGKNAFKQHKGIIDENLAKEKGRVDLWIRSSVMNGRRFLVSRRYGESVSVKDENHEISSFLPSDLLPRVEIYGQNEIHEIAQDPQGQSALLNRFLDVDKRPIEESLASIGEKLRANRKSMLGTHESLVEIEEEVERIPKLQEKVDQFKQLNLDEKMKIIPKLESERHQSGLVNEKMIHFDEAISAFRKNVPDAAFPNDKDLEDLPHSSLLKIIREKFIVLNETVNGLIDQIESVAKTTNQEIIDQQYQLDSAIRSDEDEIERSFKEIPCCEGRTGKEIGTQYQLLVREIERIRPKQAQLTEITKKIENLENERKSLLSDLSEARTERSAQQQRALKDLNHRLAGKLKLTVSPESDRNPLIDFLKDCNLDNVKSGRLAWIETAEDFSPVKLAEIVRKGADSLMNAGWGLKPVVAQNLAKLPLSKILKIEEIELPDKITIELNVAHDGNVNYRPLEKLSTGQQCTAILHMLLLENQDPLIIDQPEDNLDNAFIADRIVNELRSAKISRQFIFATHNANIPVFGDAEWIGIFDAEENHACIKDDLQGAIDISQIQKRTAEILEGGRIAFIQRKEKYGF